MNLTEDRYKDFALVKEMLETPDIIRDFDHDANQEVAKKARDVRRLFLTGEGSSRIFPAKNLMAENMKVGAPLSVVTEGARQAHEYELSGAVVFGASNSGQTKELVSLYQNLGQQGHPHRYGLTAHKDTKLESLSTETFVLSCGKEDAVAATKSVVEQALFYRSLLCNIMTVGCDCNKNQAAAADAAREILEMELASDIVDPIANAGTIYFAGRNNGVAEELTLKTNEITRKKSAFLEGTYAVHGVEEVMDPSDVVVVVDPFEEEQEKFKQVLVDGVGLSVIAISTRDTLFPTIKMPHVWGYDTFLQLLAGWNVLVSVGIANGIDLDKPVRARKVGNAFEG